MKDDISISKNIFELKEKGKPFTKIEAYLMLKIDLKDENPKGLREYARLWSWSTKKITSFFEQINYNLQTQKKQKRNKKVTLNSIKDSDLEKQKKQKGNKKETPKLQYDEFVFMYESQFNKLVSEHGRDFTMACIKRLNNYKGSSGTKYTSDYHAILSWVIKREEQTGEWKEDK